MDVVRKKNNRKYKVDEFIRYLERVKVCFYYFSLYYFIVEKFFYKIGVNIFGFFCNMCIIKLFFGFDF